MGYTQALPGEEAQQMLLITLFTDVELVTRTRTILLVSVLMDSMITTGVN